MFQRIARSPAALWFAGLLLAAHYWLVGRTNRVLRRPDASFFEPLDSGACIIALWHGEHFLVPFLGRPKDRLKVLVTIHRDGEIVAQAGQRLGLHFIRGSGDHGKEFHRKKAVYAFAAMLRALKRGESVVATADVPKVSRVAGLGLVTLAKHSRRPIVPVAMATSRRYRLSNWDRTCVNLPFGRMGVVRGEPIFVAPDASDDALEAIRRLVEERLNEATARVYALVDGRDHAGEESGVTRQA
jgi:lysophospholipid acyltransferase (LPLAT)-like uncharacterized protein